MKCIKPLYLLLCLVCFNCLNRGTSNPVVSKNQSESQLYVTVLGVAQDAGFPQIDCDKPCCQSVYSGEERPKMVSCLGLIDLQEQKKWLFDATPDIGEQLQILKSQHLNNGKVADAVFLTHAHMGHYTGLMQFGREALNTDRLPVFVMPRMKAFLETNQPWKQLVSLGNIDLKALKADSVQVLSPHVKVMPIQVPHRDELSETVGFRIEGKSKTLLFIPDIDKWDLWGRDIVNEVKQVDYALLDATFFKDGEVDRPMAEIPHPFIEETILLFENEHLETRSKIYFIHFNHTNPALKTSHPVKDSILKMGFHFAKEGDRFPL
ncbi:MBL fold metallo-hydrolase [Aestuariivivens sediminicola]|uniref:MBL fold metallo-hydrolase n=1 Tax=Aestuariivivens sediminicola TaxID=2913560 RepID=UPI001F581ACC|nr:MBL fold metallo-hydrolase [Aestuariivivens sediminicola]